MFINQHNKCQDVQSASGTQILLGWWAWKKLRRKEIRLKLGFKGGAGVLPLQSQERQGLTSWGRCEHRTGTAKHMASSGTSQQKNDCNLITTLQESKDIFREVCQKIAIKATYACIYHSLEESIFLFRRGYQISLLQSTNTHLVHK